MKLRKIEKILLVFLKVVLAVFLFLAGTIFISMLLSYFFASPIFISDTEFELLLRLLYVVFGLFVLVFICLIPLLIIWEKEQKQEQEETTKDTDNTESTPGNIMTLEDEKNN